MFPRVEALGRVVGYLAHDRSKLRESSSTVVYVLFRDTLRPLTLLLAVLAGYFADWAFPDRNYWPLAFLSIAVLTIALSRNSARWNFLVGYLWGVAFFLPHISWAQYAVGGNLPWIVLSLAEALFPALAAWGWTYIRRIPRVQGSLTLSALTFATTWVAVEKLRMVVPWGGFPWGRLGFSQSESILSRYAWLGGVPLISFVIVLVGALLAGAFISLTTGDILRVGAALAGTAVLVAGAFLVPIEGNAEAGQLNVGGVQGNVSRPGADAFSNRQEVLNNHVAGTHELAQSEAGADLDLIVWPENGTDIDPQVDQNAYDLIDGAAQAAGVPLLIGAQEYPETGGRYNVSLLWEHGEGVTGRYVKQRPVPFGEFIPARDFFRAIYPDVDRISIDMFAGDKPAVLDVPIARLDRNVPVGPIICFEVAYDDIIHDSVKNGAEILFVQTNNASFGPTNESTQQLAMSRLRAIETGRPVMQISTVGVSAIYTPTGREVVRSGHFTAEQISATVNLRTSITPAVRLGEWPVLIVSAGTVLLVAAGFIASRRAKTAK